MIVLVDTRQKPDKNADIDDQLHELGVYTERCKLYVGDYAVPTDMSTVVDTKLDMQELASNLTNDHERFRRECERAQQAGIHLVVLTADKHVKSVNNLPSWFNIRRKFNPKAPTGKRLYSICKTMSEKYGVTFDFCPRDETGARICQWVGIKPEDIKP